MLGLPNTDTRETRREDQLALSTACQEEQHIILPTTAHRQEELTQTDNLCNFLNSTENVSTNSSGAIVSRNSTKKLWTKKKRDTSRHYIVKLHYRHITFTKKVKMLTKLAESLVHQCGDEIKITIFNPDNRKLDTSYTENISNNIEPRSIIPPTSPEVSGPPQPAIVPGSYSSLKLLRLPMPTHQQNYTVPSFQPTSQEPSPSLPSPSMETLSSVSLSPISNLLKTSGKRNHKTSNPKRHTIIVPKKRH